MGKYDEFDLDIKEIGNASSGTSRAITSMPCEITKTTIEITKFGSCFSCGICSQGGRSQCGPCTVSSMRMEARC